MVALPALPNVSEKPVTDAIELSLDVIVHTPLEAETDGVIIRTGSPTT